jgi:hypothetical protein
MSAVLNKAIKRFFSYTLQQNFKAYLIIQKKNRFLNEMDNPYLMKTNHLILKNKFFHQIIDSMSKNYAFIASVKIFKQKLKINNIIFN